MKICPKCSKEFEENLEFCTDDYTELKSIESAGTDGPADTESGASSDAPEPETVAAAETLDAAEAEVEETAAEEAPQVEIAKSAAATAASQSTGLSSTAKGLIVVVLLFLIGGGLVYWRVKVTQARDAGLNRITAADMELLLKDANPMMLKRLAEDPKLREQQADNLKQLLALASQARKEGLDREPYIQAELDSMYNELLAVEYDQFINKDKGPMPPFGFIGEDRVKEFWDSNAANEGKFKAFLDAKIQLLKESNPAMKDRDPSEDEITQAKDYFAKINIYAAEASEKIKSGELGEEFKAKVELQTKLQQANLLARIYSTKVLVEKSKVTDEDVDKYIAEHPELDPGTKKAKAEEVLQKAKSGEDFAKLANEFSQDPGNKDAKGELQGGLYKDVTKGRMMPEFEAAALALEPGQIAPELVETRFGFHIIKLEKKEDVKDSNGQVSQRYDVRHILVSTTAKDPENPMSRELPVKDMVKAKLEAEKNKKVLDEILANNPVEVAVDYTVPPVSEDDLQKMMEKQAPQMQPGQGPSEGGPDAAPPAPKAPAKAPENDKK